MTPTKGMRFAYKNATRRVDGQDIPAIYVVTSDRRDRRWNETYVYVRPDYELSGPYKPYPLRLDKWQEVVAEVL